MEILFFVLLGIFSLICLMAIITFIIYMVGLYKCDKRALQSKGELEEPTSKKEKNNVHLPPYKRSGNTVPVMYCIVSDQQQEAADDKDGDKESGDNANSSDEGPSK